MRKSWRSLAFALLAATLAITVAALRPVTEHADAKGRPPLWFGLGAFKVALFADLHTRGRTGAPRRTPRPTASWPPSSTPRTQVRVCARSPFASPNPFPFPLKESKN
jgi:hypothetical protein